MRLTTSTLTTCGALAYLLLGACGESATTRELAPATGGVEAKASALCARLESCSPSALRLLYRSRTRCEESARAVFEWEDGLPGANAGTEAQFACAEALSSAPCDALLSGESPPACAGARERPAGSACLSSTQCQSGFCDQPELHACGVCAAPPQPGSACLHVGDCANQQSCVDGVCLSRGELGESCGAASTCAASAHCAEGSCRAKPAQAGAPCTADTGCLASAGLYCSAEGACAEVTIAEPGKPCGAGTAALTACAGLGVCTLSECAEGPGLGDFCDDAQGRYCAPQHQCEGGRCAPLTDFRRCEP